METPLTNHLSDRDFLEIYEPAEDSFLLLDAIESDLEFLKRIQPKVCLEIGSGSGIVITAIAKELKSSLCLSTDINTLACSATKRTSLHNGTYVDPMRMNLVDNLRANQIDLLVFNPPYVVTSDSELETSQFENGSITTKNLVYTWAGGVDGRRVVDILVAKLDTILSTTGVFYLLLLKENKPDELIVNLRKLGFAAIKFMERRIPGEYLYILKIFHASNNYA